jgi:DNA polymerase IIIc chi subunit
MEASFYHLTSSPLKKALPSLLEKAYENNMRSVVICHAENIKPLDDDLWTFSPTKFLPHGTEKPEIQPVFITDKITDNLKHLASQNIWCLKTSSTQNILQMF